VEGTSGFVRLIDEEVAWGGIFGVPATTGTNAGSRGDPRGGAERPRRRGPGPLDALAEIMLPALSRPPCVVEFSGGRDSSAVLAVALDVARRHGLSEPIALTYCFPGLEEADEQRWQERVIRHVGAPEWERRMLTSELDLVGPVAAPSLRRHGLLAPPLAHLRGLLLEVARGGAAMSGEGGDEVLGPRRLTPLRQVVGRVVGLDRRTARAAFLAVAPTGVRRRGYRHLGARMADLPWLRPAPRAALAARVVEEIATEPLDWRHALARHLASPGVTAAVHNYRLLAAEHEVLDVQPLLDPRFADALAQSAGRLGYRDRTVAMEALFGSLLPLDVLRRRSKARFNRAYFNEHSRAFVARFDGTGVDESLVDVDALVEVWRSEEPHAMSFALLQAAWLAAEDPR
jgi:asparagine synthase (glutamine-hydrolysing)